MSGESAMDKDRSSADGAASALPVRAGDPVTEVLAVISEVAAQTDKLQEVVSAAASRLPKPSRAELGAMREVKQAVSPESFLLARLDLAYRDLENAWSWLDGVDASIFPQLAEAFENGDFPVGLVDFRELARAAGQPELVGREGLEEALDLEQATAMRRAG